VDAAIDFHVVSLTGFPSTSNGQSLTNSDDSNKSGKSKSPVQPVDSLEQVTGYAKVAVITVAFDQPLFVERKLPPQPFPPGYTGRRYPPHHTGKVGNNSAATEDDGETLFFSVNNGTLEKYGTMGLARLICGSQLFESHPVPGEDHAPPRFLVPTNHLSVFASEAPAVAIAVPHLHACQDGAAVDSTTSSTLTGAHPRDNQLSFVLLMAHSVAGAKGNIWLSEKDLTRGKCALKILDPTEQTWKPTGRLVNANRIPFTGLIPLGQPTVAPHLTMKGVSRSALSGTVSSSRLPPLSSYFSSKRKLSDVAAEDELAVSKRISALCWDASPSLYRNSVTAADSALRKAAEEKARFIKEMSSHEHDDTLPEPSHSSTASRNSKASTLLGSSANQGKRAPHFRTVYDVLEENAPSTSILLEQSVNVSPASEPHQRKTAIPLTHLASSLVLHAEPWSISMLETASTLTANQKTGNMLTGLINGGVKPLLEPVANALVSLIGNDIIGVLAQPIAEEVNDGLTVALSVGLRDMLAGDVPHQIVPALTETITDEVIDAVSRAVAAKVVDDVTEPITNDLVDMMSTTLLPKLLQTISSTNSLDIVTNMTRPMSLLLPRALAHSIVPALTMTLTISPHDHNFCYKCLIESDDQSCKKCPPSMRTKSIWGMPPMLYYSMYYTGYYSTYYSAYYSDVFTDSPGIRLVRKREIEINDAVEEPSWFVPVHATEN